MPIDQMKLMIISSPVLYDLLRHAVSVATIGPVVKKRGVFLFFMLVQYVSGYVSSREVNTHVIRQLDDLPVWPNCLDEILASTREGAALTPIQRLCTHLTFTSADKAAHWQHT